MRTTLKAAAAILALVLFDAAFGQVRPVEPVTTTRIFGRMVDPNGVPIPNLVVNFRNLLWRGIEDHPATTDAQGMFTFAGARRILYEVNLNLPEMVFKGVGTIEVADGETVAMGDIVLRFSPEHKPMVHVLGPVQMTGLPAATTPNPGGTIAAVYTVCSDASTEFCDHPALHLILGDGKEVQPPAEKDQVGSSHEMISEDNRAVGWLVDGDFCCTSYPIQQMLVIFRPGKPVRRFAGDGRAIFGWSFLAGGKQIALYQGYLHGETHGHYELRDVETERLVAQWDGDSKQKAPAWVRDIH